MLRALYNGVSGMTAQQSMLDVGSNNIANINTTGFKKSEISFNDLIYQQMGAEGIPAVPSNGTGGGTGANGATPPVVAPTSGTGVRVAATMRDFRQGSLLQTGRPLDVAIDGQGFFKVTLPDGTSAYTRDGSFNVDANGNLVTLQGYQVAPNITVTTPYSAIEITRDGNVNVTDSQGNVTNAGQLELYTFNNPEGLVALGDNLYATSAASGQETQIDLSQNSSVSLRAGYLEGSNVNPAEEMTRLIVAQRAYEMNAGTVRTADQIWGLANSLVK
ncbi:flagellar basal-body rod protein FlgG [Desulfotomaculum copahuensis]|uniref:Flagellar basal-body rod protein FlgG n=1 Tax=Desulfotomaculum copahuensis TaxID=1838280 RepID=A0A1B7LBJ7_9FIRM|nr:flagellar basal-body rod protein FlgG [Desulfotomaculum copahuensis]OAT79916.1 hypothetical protein A6M21_14495 [Desulfotomaculum copahuensis]